MTRGDVLSHIEVSPQSQSSSLAQSLGSVLNSVMNPPRPARTMSDITTDFSSAQKYLAEASGIAKELWTISCDNLLIELRGFTGEESSLPSIANNDSRTSD